MIELNTEQQSAVSFPDNVVITACPGSGKTRVLTSRVIRAVQQFASRHDKVVALTYTNRAADEVQSRLDEAGVDNAQMWAGTFHRFALDWLLRPYAPYCPELKHGFSLIDEYRAAEMLSGLKAEAGLKRFDTVSTSYDRSGHDRNSDIKARQIFERYKKELRTQNVIDFDDVLYLAYRLLNDRPEIASTLASMVKVICVDEAQDIQDLQYGILSSIYRSASIKPTLFFVGDDDQCIYESLGATAKSPREIALEFGLGNIAHKTLHGNYRSTQRIIDFYRLLRSSVPQIDGRSQWADEIGLITFDNQTVTRFDLAKVIAARITSAINDGVATNDICVIAPRWEHIKPLARQLVSYLPEVDFDAPGLSPLHSSYENFWFKIARLVLTTPSPKRTRARMRWAKEALSELGEITDSGIPTQISSPRRLLRLLNGISSAEDQGLTYLREIFTTFLKQIEIDFEICLALKLAYEDFFAKAEHHLATNGETLPQDVESFRRLFSHPSGVVINSCHGVKGEEYHTVIAFGLLRGYVPHWNAVYAGPQVANDQESKLLYVTCSRAKRRLHLIAESGRRTGGQNPKPYETAKLLRSIHWSYD